MHGEGPRPSDQSFNHGLDNPKEREKALMEADEHIKERNDLDFLFDEEGRITYQPELFTDRFNLMYAAYERAVSHEVALREIAGGHTRDYRRADDARRDAHIAAADQLTADLAQKGIKLSGYEAESIVEKIINKRKPSSEEIPLLRKAFINDVLTRNED